MSVLIGDLMAEADEGYGSGGGRNRRKRDKSAKGSGGGDPSARKERGLQDDKSFRERGLRDDKSLRGRGLGDGGNLVGGAVPEQTIIRPSLRIEKGLPPKRMGELSELDFLRKAMGMGMIVSKPWGDSYRYDFICDVNQKLWRVQVRSTEFRFGHRGYAVHASVYVGRKIVGLTPKDIDVLIGYIVSRDIWYVVPVRAFTPRKNLWFYPDGSKKGAMFEKYREAWGIMTGR
jgi:hypothetical protein